MSSDKQELIQLKLPGMVAFGAGILIASGAGAKLPNQMAKGFSLPSSFPIFVMGLLIALVGLIFWRRGLRAELELSLAEIDTDPKAKTNPVVLLQSVMDPLHRLQTDLERLTKANKTEAVCERVDEILLGYILPFAEVRRKLLDLFGMDRGAEILITVAYGERMLNRTWSAAADGHLGEANKVYPDAIAAFEEVQVMLNDLEQ